MNKKNKLFKLTVLSSLFAFSLTGCNTSSSANIITTENIDLTGVEFDNVSETVTYDGLPHSIFAKNVPEGVTVTYENNGAIEIGTHKIIAHFSKKTSGYSSNVRYLETTQIATLNIVKDATNVSETLSEKLKKITMDDMDVTYNGSPFTLLLTDPTLIPAGFKALYSNNVHTSAGTYSVTCKIVNAETMVSYRTLYAKMVINKAEIDIKDVKFESITYPSDGQIHTIEATNLPDNVSVRYELVNSNITDSLPANAITNVGYKEVKAVFSVDASSQLARANYIIVNSNETDRTKNTMNARIEILAAGSVVYTIKYRVVQFDETFDPEQNKVTSRTRKYVLDSNGQPAIYSQTTLNTSYGSYISTSNLLARDGYSFEVVNNTYSDILTERGYLVPEGSQGGDIIIDYVPEIYTVNFGGENISLNSRDYTSTEERELINPKVADGYRFMGWYSDSGFNFPITSLRGLTGNRTIYGRAVDDSKLPSNFAVKDTFVTWDGTQKRVNVLGTVPSDVKARYYYYKIESDGSKTLVNGIDENNTPKDVGRYSVVVSFYVIKDGKVTNEKRYDDLNVYLVIEPASASSSSSMLESTTFTWTNDRYSGNYPTLTNYPQNATNITYEYFDTNKNSLGVGDDSRPVEPGKYLVKASYRIDNGTTEGEITELWAGFEITKKSCPIEFLNAIRSLFPDYTYEINRGSGEVNLTRGDGQTFKYPLADFADKGFTAGFSFEDKIGVGGTISTNNYLFKDLGLPENIVFSVTRTSEDSYLFIFKSARDDDPSGNYFANLRIRFSNNKINVNDVGQITTTMYLEFGDEISATYYNLPSSLTSQLTVFTSGESRVQFVTSSGEEISSISVATGSSVPSPTLKDYQKYLPTDTTEYNEYEYDVKWVSDNMFSSLSHVICDTKFVLTIVERKFNVKFVIEDSSKGIIDSLPTQTFTRSSITTFNQLSPSIERGYYLGQYYMLRPNGATFSVSGNSTFASVSRSYNTQVNNSSYCTDIVVYLRAQAAQTEATFDVNGGLSGNTSIKQIFGQPYNLPSDPTPPNGATFLGWMLNGVIVTKSSIYDEYTTGTLNFVAQYSSAQSTVTFLPENGDSYLTFAVNNNEVIPMPSTIPTKVGYIFKGWYLNNIKLEEGTIFTGGSSLVYIAQYDVIKINIIYHNNVIHSQVDEADDILVTKTADYGSIIPGPTTEEGSTLNPPTKRGYVFSGWSLDGSKLINSSNRITDVSQKLVDGVVSYYIDLYPVYKNNNYKITYAFNVENILNSATDVIFNEIVNAEQAPTRIGYYFDGWYTTSTFDAGTNFFDEILKNPEEGINADCYPYERDIVLYAKWVRKEYKVTFRYIPDINNPNNYVDYPLNGMTIAYGQLLTSAGNTRTWLTEDEIYSTSAGQGLGLTKDVTPIFTYRNGSLISEGQAFLYDPASYEIDEALRNKAYDKENPDNNTAIIYINSTINNYFNVSYIADEYGLPTIQSVRGNSEFTLKNHPVREGKRWVAYYYYYVENNQTKKYYLTSDGTINGTPLNTWNLSNITTAKNGITDYVLYSEFAALTYRLFIRTNDQESLLGTMDWGGEKKEAFIVTEYGKPYNILSNDVATDFKAYINEILATKGYKFDYWRDNFGRIITANTLLTDPRAIDIVSSYAYSRPGQIDPAKTNYEAGIYLYAQVIPLTYNLTFFPDNNTNPYVINVGYNQSYTKMGDPVKDGYRFTGWKYFDAKTFDIEKYRAGTLDPDCALADGEMNDVRYNQTRDIIAVAQYEGDQYTITYKYSILTLGSSSFTFNENDYSKSTVVENIKFSEAYTLKALNDTDFTTLNSDYKNYFVLYDFVGWLDEANQTIYPAGTTFKEYNRSTSSIYRAIYKPKQFTVEFLYQTVDNSSMSALTGTKKVTRIASREKVTFNDTISTPADPVPSSDIYGVGTKAWLSKNNETIAASGNYDLTLNFVLRYFYNNNYDDFNKAITDIVNNPTRDDYDTNFKTLTFNLQSISTAGYYNIYLNNYNSNSSVIRGSTYYNVYGNPESGDEKVLLEAGSKIRLPNINYTISMSENFVYVDPRSGTRTTNKASVLDSTNDGQGDPYTYKINGTTYKPFLRTVYVINGEYYLDGDLSPIDITGDYSNPTSLYAFTTYVSGSYVTNADGSRDYTELFNFTLKDENGEYIKSYVPSKKGAVVDDYTLDNKNEIAFAGFMNKSYTSVGTTYGADQTYRPVLIPYFYYDSETSIIRKVTYISHDQSGLGAFEESNYATQYFLPDTISYIASNTFKNAFTGSETETVYVNYLDSSGYFDYTVVIMDSNLTGGSRLRSINANNFSYMGKDSTASYDSHRFFSGRLYNTRSYQTINTYTVLGFINSFVSQLEYAGSDGPSGKSGDYFYYSNSNPTRIPAYFKKLSSALFDASNDGINNEIIAFSQTDNGEGTGNIGFDSLSKKYQAYPFFLYYGSAEDFTKSYGTSSDVSALKLTDEADYPKDTDGSSLYPESPLYGIKNFYLTLPYSDAKTNTVKKIEIDSLSELNAIYLDTPSMICNKIYNGTIDERDYFGQGDPANTSADDNFVTTYLNYQSGTNKAKLTYFYNGDDEANGLTGTEYLIQQLRNGGDKADTIRNNFNSKCFEYEYDADGNVDNATLTRMLSTKNYKTKSAEYFYIGNYESFLRNGKEYVDQYQGQVISFLDLTDDELNNFDPENPLGIVDENTRLKKVYIGTSDSYLASLTANNIKDRIDLTFMVYCLNSTTDYNITPFFFGTLDKYRNLDRSDANIALDYPLREGFLIQCLQTEDTSNLALLRDIVFAYFNDHDVASTTKFVDYTTTVYQFNADGEFTTVENSSYYYNLTVTGSLKLIFQVKLDITDTTKNIYYTSTADTFASSYFETFRQSTVAVLKYDYRTDQRYDGTTRTTLTGNDIELLFVGTKDDIGTGDNQIPWGTIRSLNANYSITSQHVAYYLSAKLTSQIVYDVVNVAALSTNIEDTRTYLNYFFNTYDENSNRYKTLLTLAGNTYYYNENIKTILAGVNTLNIKSDLLDLLTSNTLIYNALYCFKDTSDDGSKNSIVLSNFLPMYYGTDQGLLESIKAERVNVTTRFIFVKPSDDYENTADIDDVLNDDMGLAFGVDSVDGTILKQYVLSSAMPDLTANHYLNNKNRFISIITKTAEAPDAVSPAVYDIYYYFRGSSTDNEAKALTYLASDGSLKYENKFVLYEGTSTSADDDFYNYIGSIDDILKQLSNPLFRSSNFYNLLIDTSVDETIVKDPTDPDDESKWTRSYTLKSKNNSLFFAGDASTVEENSTALEFETDNITPKNTQLIDLNNDGNSPFGDSIRLFADYITILLSDKDNVNFYPVSYYRATELIETLPANTYFDYVFSGKILEDTNNIANGYVSPLFSDTVRNLQDNISVLNDATDKNLRRNNYILIRGNNSIDKGILSYGGVFTSDQPWSNGQDFFNRVIDLTASDKELNKAVPVYFESTTGDFTINDTVLLELYEGYDSIYISKDSNNNNYSSITYLGSVSGFKTTRKVNGSDLYDYISSRDFFTTNKGNQNNGYTYNTSSFNYAEINYETDAEGNNKISADSGNLKTMLFVSNDVILDKINETARNNNTSMKFYSDLFNYDLGNVAPMLLSNAYTSKTARIVNINPIVTIVGNEYTTDKGKLYSQNITNQLYVGENQFITLDAVPDGDRAPQYQNYIYKSNNQVESILFKDDMNKHLFDSEEVIGITSSDQGLLDKATDNTDTSIGSRRKVLAYYINKYIDAGPDAESPLSNIATVNDYNKIIKANYVGDGFNDKSIGEYFKTLPENGVMDLIPIVQFNKQIKVKIGEEENPDDPDNPIIDYENQDISVIAEILSMDNLLGNTSKISYLSAGWFGFANSKGLKMDGNQIANSWLSTINPALTDKIEESRVYMPRWVRRYTLQNKTLDDGTTETIVPEINHSYDGRTYYSIDNDVDTATVKNETLPTDTATIESYLTLDLVEKEEITKQDTIPNGYFVQSLVRPGALYNRLSAAYDNSKNNRVGEEYYALYLQSSDDLLADSEIFKMGTRWYLRHVPTKDFTILKSDGSFNKYDANSPYFFTFDAIEWINVTNNPAADRYYNSPYSIPSKILDVTTISTSSSNLPATKQTFKKYAFNTGDFAKYNIGGSIKENSNSDNWYNNYSNNNLTPQDVTIYSDSSNSIFNNPFYEGHTSDTFNLRSAINPEVTGKTSIIDYLGYTYDNTLDAYSDFALYKFYTYADTTSEYLTETRLYQKVFNESATYGNPDFWDSNNREQFYSFYKQRLLLSVIFSGVTNPNGYNCTYIDSFAANDFYAYNQRRQELFNIYDSKTKTFTLGDIAFIMPIVRLDWEKKS